jgi:hypothetical protein
MHPHWPSSTRGITQNLAIAGHFFTNVLCISHFGFLFIYFGKKLPEIKTDG